MSPGAGKKSPGGPGRTIFLFDTTHDAMQAEEVIIDGGFWCDMVPRPPDTAATLCGLAIEVQTADRDDVSRLLEEAGINFEIYQPVETQ